MNCDRHIFGEKTTRFVLESEYMTEHVISNICNKCGKSAYHHDYETNPGASYFGPRGMIDTHSASREKSVSTHEGQMWWQIMPRLKLRKLEGQFDAAGKQMYEFRHP